MKQSSGVGRAIVTFTLTDIMQRNAFYTQLVCTLCWTQTRNVERFWVLFYMIKGVRWNKFSELPSVPFWSAIFLVCFSPPLVLNEWGGVEGAGAPDLCSQTRWSFQRSVGFQQSSSLYLRAIFGCINKVTNQSYLHLVFDRILCFDYQKRIASVIEANRC